MTVYEKQISGLIFLGLYTKVNGGLARPITHNWIASNHI